MLKGKNALITGSTSGIGLGMARALAARGVNLMLNGLGDADEIEKNRSALEKTTGVKVAYNGADMSKPDAISSLVDATTAELGGLEILINSAGIQHTAPVEDFEDEKWEAIIAINMSSSFHSIKHALPHMRAAGWGRIINIASVHGLVASVNKAAYVAAKHGIVGLTKVVGLETAEENITCNAICPGWVRTELIEKQIELLGEKLNQPIETAARSLLEEKQPSKYFISTGMLGEIALFLCSDAASQITGSAIPVDGGWTAR